jgi:hypothetical protein
MKVSMKTRSTAAAAAAAVLLAGCGVGQFYGPPAPPPPRPRILAGPGWAPEVAYLKAHPVRVPKGMQVGILVSASSPSAISQNLNGGSWSGVAVVPGGWTVSLSSDEGDNGMGALVSPGDLFEFPAANLPVDAPGDDGNDAPAVLLERAVVSIP